MKNVLVLIAAFATSAHAHAQSSAVPPPAASAESDQLIGKEVLSAPQRIVTGVAFGQAALKAGGPVIDQTFKAAGGVGYVMTGAELIYRASEGYNQSGMKGAMREGGQVVYGAVKDAAIEAVVKGGVGFWMGVGSVEAQLVTSSWKGGIWIGDAVERKYGTEMSESVFRWIPDSAKEFVSGVKQVDENSQAWKEKLDADAQAAARQRMFNTVAANNAEQARLRLDAEASARSAATESVASTQGAAPSNDALIGLLRDTILQTQPVRQSQPVRSSSPATAAAPTTPAPTILAKAPPPPIPVPLVTSNRTSDVSNLSSCRAPRPIDPKTGCHFSHDENAHPNGCKC